jgi:hypothetical protein
MEPISPRVQSSAPTFSFATLRQVLAELTAEYPDRHWRLVKAANIVAIRSVERSPSGPGWWVESESESGKFYFVLPVETIDTCNCQDYLRRGGPCKHILAVELYERCEIDAGVRDPSTCAHGEYGPICGECYDGRGEPDDHDPSSNVITFPTPAYAPDDRFVLTAKGYAALAGDDTQSPA